MSPDPEAREELDAEADYGAVLMKGRKRVVLAIVLVAVAAALYPVGRWLWDLYQVGVEDEDTPFFSESESTLDGVDLDALHSALLPNWFIAVSNDSPEAAELLRAVRNAVASEDRLLELVDEFAAAVGLAGIERAIRFEQLVVEWNDYLDSRERHFVLILPMSTSQRQHFYALSYFGVARFDYEPDDGEPIPVRLVTRLDNLNVREAYLGHAGALEGVASIVVDRIAESAANRVWPLLAEDPFEGLSDLQDHFREAVRAELAAALGSDFAALETAAPARHALVRVQDAIDERRACGAAFRLRRLPLRGFNEEQIIEFDAIASARNRSVCPDLKGTELAMLEDASRTLRQIPGIRAGVQALTAVLARTVTHHEIRHIIDFRTGLDCDCPSWAREQTVQELSAYLASMANSAAPATLLYTLCEDHAAGLTGQHQRALNLAFERVLDDGCLGPIPDDLPGRARQAEEWYFGRASEFELPRDYPDRVRSRWF